MGRLVILVVALPEVALRRFKGRDVSSVSAGRSTTSVLASLTAFFALAMAMEAAFFSLILLRLSFNFACLAFC